MLREIPCCIAISTRAKNRRITNNILRNSNNIARTLSYFLLFIIINISMLVKGVRGYVISHPRRCSRLSSIGRRSPSISHPMTKRSCTSGPSALNLSNRPAYLDIEDVLLSGLNSKQDVSVKVISCKEVVQEAMDRKVLTAVAARALGEAMACGLLMGSGLKGEETLQINIVGEHGMKNIIIKTDGMLRIKGMVGDNGFNLPTGNGYEDQQPLGCYELVGSQGQVQVIRDHPAWKTAMNGIVLLRDADIATNLAYYMAESEQRHAVLMADVKISSENRCEHALALMVESLPGLDEMDLEKCIDNVTRVQRRKLSSYLSTLSSSSPVSSMIADDAIISKSSVPLIPSLPASMRMEEVLHLILDDCFVGMDDVDVAPSSCSAAIRYSKTPTFTCECNEMRVLRAVSLLPAKDVDEIMSEGKDVVSSCGFCGKAYTISTSQLSEYIAMNSDNNDS